MPDQDPDPWCQEADGQYEPSEGPEILINIDIDDEEG